MSGKGDVPRPYTVTPKQFSDNWERTFGKGRSDRHAADDVSKKAENIDTSEGTP